MDATDEMTSQQKLKSGSTRGWNISDDGPPITWRDALESVINSRKLSDALGNPSTRRKFFYCPIWQITLYIIRQEQHCALLQNKRKETYINHTTQIRRLTNNLTKPGTFILL